MTCEMTYSIDDLGQYSDPCTRCAVTKCAECEMILCSACAEMCDCNMVLCPSCSTHFHKCEVPA